MAKEKVSAEQLGEGLDTAPEVKETPKVVKEQTPEEAAMLVAGVEKLKRMGVSDSFAKVMSLVPLWNGDKNVLGTAKEEVINHFGGSEKLKDFVDGDFQNELNELIGAQKCLSTLNNIKAFYARRAKVAKVKTIQVTISGTVYNVNSEYFGTLTNVSKEEKRELVLAHPDTKVAENIQEIL